ncbi:polysaccharide pyruvyl transferase family protein [Metabacillus idriensis]|uniref:polysaccharide pyruvyl transferase family protein n=1 Tax=Metabacillus idriensis TaxID=324768 RepID=UPI00174A75E2|nr:polysaccharide pyruvyl transferase family protein [Metabacillus idriensis]
MKKKILVNAYFATNLGDDLFLKVLFDRYQNVEWELLTSDESYNKIFIDYKNVKIIKSLSVKLANRRINLFYKMNDLLLKYKRYEALVIIGGSIFMENASWQEHLIKREYLPNKFKMMNKKTFIIGANFGPYNDTLFIEKYREFFSMFDDICFRDNYSYSIFKDLDNVRFAPDVVFNLNSPIPKNKDKSVGFSIIDILKREGLKEYYQIYNEKIIQLVEKYIEQGYKVKLFSFCEREGDLDIINYIYNNVKKNSYVEIINYERNINKFLEKFKTCEIIVGTRFHSIILAILFNQRVFPIIYSEKTYNVLKDLNMEDNYCYIKNIKNLDIKNEIMTTNKIIDRHVLLESHKQFKELDLLLQYH